MGKMKDVSLFIDDLASNLRYALVDELPPFYEAEPNTLYICKGDEYILFDGCLTKLGAPGPGAMSEPTKRIKGTNCPNCGAPLKGGKCEYCGTENA